MDSVDNVRAAVETIAQLIPNPALRAAWLNYAAAQAERDAEADVRLSNLAGNQQRLRNELDSVIDAAIRRSLEGTELRVMGFGAMVDALDALTRRIELIEERGAIRTAMLESIILRLPPRTAPEEEAAA